MFGFLFCQVLRFGALDDDATSNDLVEMSKSKILSHIPINSEFSSKHCAWFSWNCVWFARVTKQRKHLNKSDEGKKTPYIDNERHYIAFNHLFWSITIFASISLSTFAMDASHRRLE